MIPNSPTPLRVVILGGGTAGWMTAAALTTLYRGAVSVTLVESELIGTVGVGEATVPHLRYFNERLGINEQEFMEKTNATYKLGIQFRNWSKIGDAYIHPFGIYGSPIDNIPFHQYWVKAYQSGYANPISDFSIAAVAADAGKFTYPDSQPHSLLSKFGYAFHIDASLYARFLRDLSEKRGVIRIEGRVEQVKQNSAGDISHVTLASGQVVAGDLFIDCSGFRSLLLDGVFAEPFEDWSQWLICDRAVAAPSESDQAPLPYTIATAESAGWRWRIPLRSRVGNGYVYSSQHISDDEAASSLEKNLGSSRLANFNFLKFKAGRRQRTWVKNCIAIGLSGGFLEPLESTSIYLIQMSITKLVEFFPRGDDTEILRNEYNRELAMEYERIRDFLILHYKATTRDDSLFWEYCRDMDIPESLERKINLFKSQGQVERYTRGMFLEPSWVAVYIGQGIVPDQYHPFVDRFSPEQIRHALDDMRGSITRAVAGMPTHTNFIECMLRTKISAEKTWPAAAMSLYGVFS